MKKILLALMLVATFSVTACKDKQTEQSSSEIPYLAVKSVPIINKSERFERTLPSNKNEEIEDDDFGYTHSYIAYNVSTVETGYAWLDKLLYDEMIGEPELEDKEKEKAIKALPTAKEKLVALANYFYEQNLVSAKDFESLGYQLDNILSYVGQRENILTFTTFNHSYTGGAHGMYWTDYIIIDTKKKTRINLTAVFAEKDQDRLKADLWDVYKMREEDEEALFTSKSDFYISTSFYFNQDGVSFVYRPYALGPFAEGEITLTLPWHIAKEYINSEYNWENNGYSTPVFE